LKAVTMRDDDDDDDDDEAGLRGTEFDCPECSANNPVEDGFRVDDELHCHYCGVELRVVLHHGRLALKLT
jgi:DNA-directed RNA polymerase subunit RPC12/RpoP